VVLVRDVAVDSTSIDDGGGIYINGNGYNAAANEHSDFDEIEDIYDAGQIRLTEVKNGQKIIKQAPTLQGKIMVVYCMHFQRNFIPSFGCERSRR
jgi:hypothetical protein